MFWVTKDLVEPITSFARKSDPAVDFSRMGDWGILFICCGALMGQTTAAKARLLHDLNAPVSPEAIVQRGDDEYYAIRFSGFIEEWSQDVAGLSLAKQRLASMGRSSGENYEAMLNYFGIAIMLNSLTNLDIDEFRELKEWVSKSTIGWPGFFFAAGLLLSNKPKVKWNQWGSVLLGINANLRNELRELFNEYSKER